jgi:DNA-binding transcriptional LysR family regulator
MAEWDVRKLHILRTLRERGTVTATAEALHMTPSAVSQQLTNLARQLGVPLLEARGRRVRLTDAARLVLTHTEPVFEQLERAEAALAAYTEGEAGGGPGRRLLHGGARPRRTRRTGPAADAPGGARPGPGGGGRRGLRPAGRR